MESCVILFQNNFVGTKLLVSRMQIIIKYNINIKKSWDYFSTLSGKLHMHSWNKLTAGINFLHSIKATLQHILYPS